MPGNVFYSRHFYPLLFQLVDETMPQRMDCATPKLITEPRFRFQQRDKALVETITGIVFASWSDQFWK